MSNELEKGKLAESVCAHSKGNMFLAWTENGSHLITGSEDGLTRLHPFSDSHQPESGDKDIPDIDCSYSVLTVDSSGKYIAVGNDDGEVALYSTSGRTVTSPIFRTNLAIRCAKFSHDGKKLAITADDRAFKVVSVPEGSVITAITAHSKSVQYLCWSADDSLLFGACCNGQLVSFDVDDGSIVRTWSLFSQFDPEDTLMSIAYSCQANRIVVPQLSGLQVVDPSVDGVKEEERLVGHSARVVLTSISPNGAYCATSSEDNCLNVFNLKTFKCIARIGDVKDVSDIAWNPTKESVIAVATKSGQYFLWSDMIPSDLPKANEDVTFPHMAVEKSQSKDESLVGLDAKDLVDDEVLVEGDSHEDNEGDSGPFDRDEEMIDDLEDFIVDENGQDYRLQERRERIAQKHPRVAVNLPPLHQSFQPNSTKGSIGKRYLAFNLVGYIESIDQDTHCAITIYFHDIGSHRPINMRDHFKFKYAALIEQAAVFASTSLRGSDDTIISNSTLFHRKFESWDVSNEWTATLPAGEDVVGLSLTVDWVAASTSHNYIRIFSSGGSQKGIISVAGGPIVATAAHENSLIVATNSSSEMGSGLTYQILDMEELSFTVVANPLALSIKASLCWIGFSEAGIPMTYDSEGVLRMVNPKSSGVWMPVLDSRPLRAGKQDYYWPVAVVEDSLLFVWCKSGQKEPGFPKPIISDVELQMPFLSDNKDLSKLENSLAVKLQLYRFHEEAYAEQGDDDPEMWQDLVGRRTSIDKILLQLIALSCQSKASLKALEFCTRLMVDKSLELAYKIANKHQLSQLCERIELLRQSKYEESLKKKQDEKRAEKETGSHSLFREPEVAHSKTEFIAPSAPAANDINDVFFTPAKRNSDKLFSSPNTIPIEDEAKKVKVNPFKKKTAAAPSAQQPPIGQPEEKASKKRKTVQAKMSSFVKTKAPIVDPKSTPEKMFDTDENQHGNMDVAETN